jgi:PilZ domain
MGYRQPCEQLGALIMSSDIRPMPNPARRFAREVRRARRLSAWLVTNGIAQTECQVLDISANGAKIVASIPSEIPARFELAFFQGENKRRVCEVVWRRGKLLGVKFVRE